MSEQQMHARWAPERVRRWLTPERLTDYGVVTLLLAGAVWAILALPGQILVGSLLLVFAPIVTAAAFWRGLAQIGRAHV